MHSITHDDLHRLFRERHSPCVSIYLPTPHAFPDRQQGPIRYRNLVDRAEESLREQHLNPDLRTMLDRFRALERDSTFWDYRQPLSRRSACRHERGWRPFFGSKGKSQS